MFILSVLVFMQQHTGWSDDQITEVFVEIATCELKGVDLSKWEDFEFCKKKMQKFELSNSLWYND